MLLFINTTDQQYVGQDSSCNNYSTVEKKICNLCFDNPIIVKKINTK